MTDLILLHGVGLDCNIWRPLQASLTGVTTHAYDLRGHAGAPDWSGPASLDGFVDDLWDYADSLGLNQFALCGFSLGAMIAQWATLLNPARISHLVLLNGTYDRSPDQMAGVRVRYNQAETSGPQSMIDAALKRWLPEGFATQHPEYQDQIRLRLENNNTDQFMRSYKVFAFDGGQITGRLTEIKIPTLIATGGLDTGSTPEMAQKMAAEIANAECTIFEDAAHMLPMQKPNELARLIIKLLGKDT